MTISRESIRQDVGGELGIIKTGIGTAATATSLTDTSDDTPFDPADSATRYENGGIYIDMNGGGTYFYRQNLVYVPASQQVTFGNVTGLNAASPYELHLEPFLHPLTDWPRLIDDALALIRRISWQYILLTGDRGYYDLSDWADITGVEQIRRLYNMGSNKLRNANFAEWPTGITDPDQWTSTGTVIRAAVINYPHGINLAAAATLVQSVSTPPVNRRVKAVVWCKTAVGATGRLTITTKLIDGSTERTGNKTLAASKTEQISVEIETTQRTHTIEFKLDSAVAASDFWAPMLFDLSTGRRARIQPMTTLMADDEVRLYVPSMSCVGQFALLRAYDALATEVATTTAPDELIIAATAVQVLNFLAKHPQIPNRQQYAEALVTWEDKFKSRSREHMRKLSKTQQLWEAGELQASSHLALRRVIR